MDFVGRGLILEELHTWFSDPNNKSALLAGDGGTGKSAIAYRYALDVPTKMANLGRPATG
jgi:hypothetical protein